MIVIFSWVVLWFIFGVEFLLGGNIFGIFNVIVFVVLGGFMIRKIFKGILFLLLGMFVVGFILCNVLGINVVCYIDKKWLVILCSMVFVVIFM